jgi:uncharacterized protein involved in tellurium resistance
MNRNHAIQKQIEVVNAAIEECEKMKVRIEAQFGMGYVITHIDAIEKESNKQESVIQALARQMIEFRDEGFICLMDDEGENIPDAEALIGYYRNRAHE